MPNDTLTITREQAYGGKVPPIPDTHEDAGLALMETGKTYEAWLDHYGGARKGLWDQHGLHARILLRRKAEPRRWLAEEVEFGWLLPVCGGEWTAVRIVSEAPLDESKSKARIAALEAELVRKNDCHDTLLRGNQGLLKRISELAMALRSLINAYDPGWSATYKHKIIDDARAVLDGKEPR